MIARIDWAAAARSKTVAALLVALLLWLAPHLPGVTLTPDSAAELVRQGLELLSLLAAALGRATATGPLLLPPPETADTHEGPPR